MVFALQCSVRKGGLKLCDHPTSSSEESEKTSFARDPHSEQDKLRIVSTWGD